MPIPNEYICKPAQQMQLIISKGNFGYIAEACNFNASVEACIKRHLASGMPTFEQCPNLMLIAYNKGDYIELAALAYFMHMG